MTADRSESLHAAIETLKTLGCHDYEARCFVALTRMPSATARDISNVTDIPRSRVYDAMDELSEKGLVEIHYSSPRRYRAIDIEDAVAWFRERHEQHLEEFEEVTESLPPLDPTSRDNHPTVWTLDGLEGILIRMKNLVESAEQYVVIFIDDTDQFNREVLKLLAHTDVPLQYVLTPPSIDDGEITDSLDGKNLQQITVEFPLLELESVERVTQPITALLVDGESTLIRTRTPSQDGRTEKDHAVLADGKENSLVRCFRMVCGL